MLPSHRLIGPSTRNLKEIQFSKQDTTINLASLRISEKMKNLIMEGFKEGYGYKSRSEAMQAVITAMLAQFHNPNEIRAVFQNPDWGIAVETTSSEDTLKTSWYPYKQCVGRDCASAMRCPHIISFNMLLHNILPHAGGTGRKMLSIFHCTFIFSNVTWRSC